MVPDPTKFLERANIKTKLVGFYDAPDPQAFKPLLEPAVNRRGCIFAYYKQWQKGRTLHLTSEKYGCGGAGHWLCGVESRSEDDYVEFLVDEEGLKASHELMREWLKVNRPYQQEHDHILIGPLNDDQYPYLKSVTFFVKPDQLALLITGAQYNRSPGDPLPVLTPFGAGCMQMVSLFPDLSIPQGVLGATDIAMRQYLPADVVAFTVTKSLYAELCALDEDSFLEKPFWERLQKARSSL
jgi:hypothetical protein